DRLESAEQSAQEAGGIGVQPHRSRQIESESGGGRLRVSKATRNAEVTGAVLAREPECVGISEHVVRRSEIQPRSEPRSYRRRNIDARLHRALALEPRIIAKQSVAIARRDESE